MKTSALIAGVAMNRFGKHLDTGLKALGGPAVTEAIADAGVAAGEIGSDAAAMCVTILGC